MALSNSKQRYYGCGIHRAIVFAPILLCAIFASAQEIDENEFKAAFLFNVSHFVEWPNETFKSAEDPVVDCIVGQNPVSDLLERAAKGNRAGGRKFVVRPLSESQSTNGCNVLFIAFQERKRWQPVLDRIRNQAILTVGDAEGFAERGGVVNFQREGDRIRIQINLEAAEQQNLKISSKLSSLSQIVKTTP